jgi:hypothetical protein
MAFGGVFSEERKRQWKEDGHAGDPPELLFKGCEDHIAHLASKDFEKRLVERAQSWGRLDHISGAHHVSSVAVRHIVARLRSALLWRSFRAFVAKHGGKPPKFERYSETRYAAIDVMCLRFWQNRGHIILFLRLVRSLLTEEDLKALKIVLDPEMMKVIFVRALLASHVLLPVMKEAKEMTSPEAYLQKVEALTAKVTLMANNPKLLSSAELEVNDLQVATELTPRSAKR